MIKKKNTTYAQNREDVILDAFFADKKSGSYIDIGAGHPTDRSVTKLLYMKGWRGVNIEPDETLIQLLIADRPSDLNIKACINKVNSLKALIGERKMSKIDFLKVDTGGDEGVILKQSNFKDYCPEVICVESGRKNDSIQQLLKESGYELFFNDGLNEYYSIIGSKRKKKFSFPEIVADNCLPIVPFIPHAEKIYVDEDYFNEIPELQPTERVGTKQAIKWSLIGLDEAIHGGLQYKIVNLKRVILYTKIQKVLAVNKIGRLPSTVQITSSKVRFYRAVLVAYTILSKISNRVLGGMK